MICKFAGVCCPPVSELANLNHTRIIMFSSVLIDREVRLEPETNTNELRDLDTRA